MLNSETLEIAVGMVFLFLLMALICTAIKEWIEGVLKWRAMDLERGLRTMLADPTGKITAHLFSHPEIFSLFAGNYDRNALRRSLWAPGNPYHMRLSSRRNLPSYIPASSFSAAFIDLVGKGPISDTGVGGSTALSIEMLRDRASKLQSAHLRRIMLSAIDYGAGDLEKVRKSIERWFDATMDRTSGWYKRRTQTVLFLIGLCAAIGLNVDSMNVLHRLTSDKTFRDVVVKEASVARAPKSEGQSADPVEEIHKLHGQIENVDLPVGWKQSADTVVPWVNLPVMVPTQLCNAPQTIADQKDQKCHWNSDASIFRMVIGWLITALAVMLGAPFWFDVLNRIMVIRSTVKPHEKSPEEASQDKQDTRKNGGGTTDTSDQGEKKRATPGDSEEPPKDAGKHDQSWTDFTEGALSAQGPKSDKDAERP